MVSTNTLESAREQLQFYNAKASELNNSTFRRQAQERDTSFQLLPVPFRAVRENGPDEEAMKAFVLTFRLFLRDRDGLSFREIEQLYESIPVGEGLRKEIREIRAGVNEYLDADSPFVIFGEEISRRDLLDTWMWGEVAHFNAPKRERLAEWRVADDVRPLFQHEFETVMLRVLQSIFWVRQANLAALAELDASGSSRVGAV
jgi:hypothetical protein